MNIFTISLFICFIACQTPKTDFDIVIRNGQIIDGTGEPAVRQDIGIKDGKIADIGDLTGKTSKKEIDAGGMIVTPGFIDLHTHTERKMLAIPSVENYIRQGVTTVLGGNCGSSPYPIGEFLQKARKKGVALNVALLVGHNTVRKEVMGTENRKSTKEELAQMEKHVQKAMEEGAFGMSTGLKYIPGAYANTEEVAALAQVVSDNKGIYATHMREEGLGLLEAVKEAIDIGKQSGVPVHISHHKAVGKSMWGSSEKTLQRIDEAVNAGMDVTLDQYPYTATSTGLTVTFPAWSLAGGKKKINERLKDPETRARIKEGIMDNILHDRGGGDPASIVVATYSPDPSLEGKNLSEITEMRGKEPTVANAAETLMDLQSEGGGKGIYHCLKEDDVERIMKHPLTMVASDGVTVEFGAAKPHPRSYGTYPRVLGRYVREKGILSLEEAIRKMTAMPAERLALRDRGKIARDMWADIVVFSADQIMDSATWTDPHQFPEGVHYVLVNGQVVVEHAKWTEVYPGKVLHGSGKK